MLGVNTYKNPLLGLNPLDAYLTMKRNAGSVERYAATAGSTTNEVVPVTAKNFEGISRPSVAGSSDIYVCAKGFDG
jgi:hypothetical protein